MGGLGNPRRGGRSPPLLIGALIACVLVLGFNYWVSSSRNLDLQKQLFEMEGAVRRAEGERLTLEEKKNEFEEELRIQKDQIPRMEGRYKIQLETLLANWKQEKASLVLNISSSARTIQMLKAQLAKLEETPKLLQECQTNQINLSAAMTDCKAQLGNLQKECAAKPPQQDKSPPDSPKSQESHNPSLSRTGQPEKPGLDDTKKPPVPAPEAIQTDTGPDAPSKAKLSALETNEIPKAGEGEAPPSLPGGNLPKPSLATRKSDVPQQELPVGVAKQEGKVEVMETHTAKLLAAGNDVVEVDKADQPLDKPVNEPVNKPGEQPPKEPGDKPQDKPGNQQGAAESETVKQAQLKDSAGEDQAPGRAALGLKGKLADYNGDDENEGEFEADKQAELAKH